MQVYECYYVRTQEERSSRYYSTVFLKKRLDTEPVSGKLEFRHEKRKGHTGSRAEISNCRKYAAYVV